MVLAINLALYRLGDALLERYQRYKGDQRAMDFADLEWLAAKLMADEETPVPAGASRRAISSPAA
jgi:ATP-dependent helicase/nuclease subunit A